MKLKFRMFRRKNGTFFLENRESGKQKSLRTKNQGEAERLLAARNEAEAVPNFNLQIARAYLLASDPDAANRTWGHVMRQVEKMRTGETQERWQRAILDRAFDPIRNKNLLETTPEVLLKVLENGTVSTNVFLRRLHNFALQMNWIPSPILSKAHWPIVRHGEKRAIKKEEHVKIVTAEKSPERKAFYELLWHFGGAQTDIASLKAEDVDWTTQTLSYQRKKTTVVALLRFSNEVAKILKELPATGPLFPRLVKMHEKHRASEFKQLCRRLQISGVTLHSYRYSWAERAKKAGYPERFAQQALGHNSKAVHRAYAKNALVTLPALDDYELSSQS